MTTDFEKLSLDELRAMRTQIDRAISSFETRKRREALAAAEQVARDHGFNLNDLTGKATRGRRATTATGSTDAKYANPEDASQTWSGRGRRPRWVTEQLDAGRSLDDFRI